MIMRKVRSLAAAALLAAWLLPAPAAANSNHNGANCVGASVSQLGVVESGLFWILRMFGGPGVGEVASTHCDPSWD